VPLPSLARNGHRSDDDEGPLLGQSGRVVYPSVKLPSCRSHSIGNCCRRSSSSRVAGCRPSRMLAPYAGLLSSTLAYVEKVRSQFLSLRQITRGRVFSGRSHWQSSPISVAISNLSSGLRTGRTVLLFSKKPVSLRTSVLYPFGTVLEIQSFRVTYELQLKEVRPSLSDGREPPVGSCNA
jgi:hypothetical protein